MGESVPNWLFLLACLLFLAVGWAETRAYYLKRIVALHKARIEIYDEGYSEGWDARGFMELKKEQT